MAVSNAFYERKKKRTFSATTDKTASSKGESEKTGGVSPTGTPPTRVSSTQSEETKWHEMKPLSGALNHSGLKWERVKHLVHVHLESPHLSQRVDATRHLGLLQCADSSVIYALREKIRKGDDIRVIFEATTSLISLGCWDKDVIKQLVHFLLESNREMKLYLLKAMVLGKNIQYVNKRLSVTQDLFRALSLLSMAPDVNDEISFYSALTLGKFCVCDSNAKTKLYSVVEHSNDTHLRAQALRVLVDQMRCCDVGVVRSVLHQLQHSYVWRDRKDACTLLIHLGAKYVLLPENAEDVFNILERRLWDEPNAKVRREVARVIAALGLYATACEKVEKKLADSSETVRGKAVISVGTLGMNNERIIRILLEMMDLESSEYVRLRVIRTLGVLGCSDKRVLRVLRVREAAGGPMAREATRTLQMLREASPTKC